LIEPGVVFDYAVEYEKQVSMHYKD